MADRPLSDAGTPRVARPLTSADRFYIVQSGVGKYGTIDDVLNQPFTYTPFSGNRNLVPGDELGIVWESTGVAASTLTIPADTGPGSTIGPADIPAGAVILGQRIGTGTLAFVLGGAVTAIQPYGLAALQQGSMIKARHRAYNQWVIEVA